MLYYMQESLPCGANRIYRDSTYYIYDSEKDFMKQRWLAVLLCAAMLLSTVAGAISCTKPGASTPPVASPAPADPPTADSPLTSARAVDHGEMIYYLDDHGTLWTSYHDHATRLSALDASQICIDGETLWYTSGNTLYTYDLANGKTAEYARQSAPITTFALCDGKVYYLCTDKLYQDDRLIMDLSARKAPDGRSLSTVCDFELREDDLILFYLPNPNYQNEDTTPGYLLSDRNDTYITYQYTLSTDTLAPYDFEILHSGSTNASSSEGITINGWSLPFEDYPVNSYFTQNGGPCSCHNRGGCVSNTKTGENCIRYWPNKSKPQIDLRGVQCMGFARFCQWRLYGVHDYGNSTDFYNAFGSKLAAGDWTANTVKETFTEVGAGGHIRTGAGHSLFVISVTSTGFVTYECNTSAKDCKIYTRQWTWASFFSYAGSRELLYYNMPRGYVGEVTPPEESYQIGTYRVAADSGLSLRAQATTSSTRLLVIPNGAILRVTDIQKVGSYYWGYTSYDGQSGWVRLDYTVFQSSEVASIKITTPPTKTNYTVGDSFSTAGMTVEARFTDGTAFEIAGYTCTGYNMEKAGTYTVKVVYGEFSDSFTITVKEKVILPTSITLELPKLTLLVGDTYNLSYSILPEDTTQKTITWTTTDRYTATITDGKIEAVGSGVAVIKATTENGLTATCRVTVITMPTGTNWSVTEDGAPLTALPFGIEAVDYSIRYRVPKGDGWGDWVYAEEIPSELTDYQCQFRSFTATFVNTLDGQTVELFTVELNQVIDLKNYILSKEGYLFTGWYTDPQAAETHDADKAANRKITVTGDLLLYAGWIPLDEMAADHDDPFATAPNLPKFGMAGVELLPSGEATGLRFLARISTGLIAEIESLHKSNQSLQPSKATETGIGFGMVVRMRSYTVAPLVKDDSNYLYKGGAVTVPAQRTYASYNGYILYNAFVCGYTAEYYKTDFVARPYITYADVNGLTHTYYFTVTGEGAQGGGHFTSLYAEAQKMVASDSVDPVIKKWLEDNILN